MYFCESPVVNRGPVRELNNGDLAAMIQCSRACLHSAQQLVEVTRGPSRVSPGDAFFHDAPRCACERRGKLQVASANEATAGGDEKVNVLPRARRCYLAHPPSKPHTCCGGVCCFQRQLCVLKPLHRCSVNVTTRRFGDVNTVHRMRWVHWNS